MVVGSSESASVWAFWGLESAEGVSVKGIAGVCAVWRMSRFGWSIVRLLVCEAAPEFGAAVAEVRSAETTATERPDDVVPGRGVLGEGGLDNAYREGLLGWR